MRELALFSGIGGISLGLKWAIPELRTICHVERNPYCAGVLIKNMEQGLLDTAPIWSDICTFDGKPWKGKVDIISGGFPCQDISFAGKGAGIVEGKTRSGLWHEYARIIGEIRPSFVFVENVAALLVRGVDVVLGSLSSLGYDAQWRIISAQEIGAPHKRERIFLVAYRHDTGESASGFGDHDHGEKEDERREKRPLAKSPRHISSSNSHNEGKPKPEGIIADKRGRDHHQAQIGNTSHNNRKRRPEVLCDPSFAGDKPKSEKQRNAYDSCFCGKQIENPNHRSERRQREWPKEIRWESGFSWCENVERIEDFFNRSDIPQPIVRRKGDGIPFYMERIKSLGNAVVPQCAERAAKEMIVPFLIP